MSEHNDELRTWTLTGGSSKEHWTSGWSVEQATSDTWRGSFFWTTWTGSATTLYDVVVRGVKYQRRSAAGRWRYVGPIGGAPSAKQWVTSELAVARTVRVVATAEINGVSCIGVQVNVDLLAACTKYPSSDAFYVTLHDLSATKDQVARWAATGTETDVIWIGRADHFIHEQVDDYAAPAGKWGVLRCHSAWSSTHIGEKIVPPITVPSPVSTPSQVL